MDLLAQPLDTSLEHCCILGLNPRPSTIYRPGPAAAGWASWQGRAGSKRPVLSDCRRPSWTPWQYACLLRSGVGCRAEGGDSGAEAEGVEGFMLGLGTVSGVCRHQAGTDLQLQLHLQLPVLHQMLEIIFQQ